VGIKTEQEWVMGKDKGVWESITEAEKNAGTKESSKVWLGPDDEEVTQRGNKLTRPLDRE